MIKFKEKALACLTEDEEISCTLIPSDRSQVAKLAKYINHVLSQETPQVE